MKLIIAFCIGLSFFLTISTIGCAKEDECFQCNSLKGYTLYCKEDDNNLRVMQNGYASQVINAREYNAANADEALTLLKKDTSCNKHP